MINKLINLIKRAVITNPSSDDGQFGVSQNTYFGKTGKAHDVYAYGSHAVPPEGTLTLLFNVNAEEDNQAQIPVSDQFRTKGKKPGEYEAGNMLVGSILVLFILSQYKRADEAPVFVSQYIITLSSNSSLLRAVSHCLSSPSPQSVQDQIFL